MENDFMLEDELAERAIQKKALLEKWTPAGFFRDNDDDPWGNMDASLILENQRLYHDDPARGCDNEYNRYLRRLSVPMAYRVWRNLIAHSIVSVQPFFQVEDDCYALEHEGDKTRMVKSRLKATDHKMKAVWSLEAAQDLRSHNNIDAEAELCAVISQELCLELDRHVLNVLRRESATQTTWDFNAALGDTIMEKYESLYIELVNTSRVVEMMNGRGAANWIVTSPEIASIFETATAGFDPVSSDWFSRNFGLGVQYVGTINSRWKLYKDPLFPTSSLLMGHKGNHPYDSGYFLCPETLIKLAPVVLDPNSFAPRRNIVTSYAEKLDDRNFYARMNVTNFIV